ncbi:ribosome recycling factor [Antarcticibacterium arcticum]|uniref:Ribosome-recycling factor n=1 Tax=Antarcticibacterium arcticum TaxID=2585771 RepID=A0A5B8YQN2_9FLAO|nr:ribosome recycling factor [Antarcticibacterium arcticum]QED38736.1 ribosome recycling factor [Antarcticibacterium arcticum]
MNEEVDFILDSTEENMQQAIKHLEKQLLNIRAGKASPAMLGSVMVEYYGSMTPLNQVANISTPDARTITIQPFERNTIPNIEKGIMVANLGFNPMNNGESVIISVPPLTEERRRELAKQAKAEAEDAKIGIRNDRKVANNDIKKLDISEDLMKIAEDNVQQLTDTYIKKVDSIFDNKEKEIMTV